MGIRPFKQGANSPPCQHLLLVCLIYPNYLPSTLGIWFFNTSVALLLHKKVELKVWRTLKSLEIFPFLTSQPARLATVLWMLEEHVKILGQRQRTLLIAVAKASTFSYTSSLSPNSYRVIVNKIWPMYRFFLFSIFMNSRAGKCSYGWKKFYNLEWLECWGQSEYRFYLQISLLLGIRDT